MAVYRPTYRDQKTGKQKHSDTWWYEFTYDGDRIRESAKTTSKTVAKLAEEKRRRELEEAGATGKPAASAKDARRKRTRRVQVALDEYRAMYAARDHQPKGVEIVNGRSAVLEKYLGSLLAVDLSDDRIAEYIGKRRADEV